MRWVVLLLGVVLTVSGATFVHQHGPAKHQATARLLLMLPVDSRREAGSPFLYLPNGLVVLSGIVSDVVFSQATTAAIAEHGMERQYEVGLDPVTPIITLSVEGSDPNNVVRTRDWLVAQMEAELSTVQEEVASPPHQRAYAHVFMDRDVAYPVQGDGARSVAGVLAAGGLASMLLFLAFGRPNPASPHAIAQRPQRRWRSSNGPPHEPSFLPAWVFVALYSVLLLCIPTRLVVGAIGAPGAPANLLAIGLLLWWGCALVGGQLGPYRLSPFRVAIAIFTSAVLASYAAGHAQGWYQPSDIRPRFGVRMWRVAEVPEMTATIGSASDRGLLALAGWIGIALFTAEGLRSWRELDRVIAWLVAAGTFAGGLGVVQYFTGLNVAAMMRIPYLRPLTEFGHVISRSELNRIVSTSTHPIELAVVMACMLPLALHVAFYSQRIVAWLPVLVMGLAALMTVSRSGVVVAAVAILVLFFGWPNRRRVLPLIALPLLALGGPIVLPGLLGTIRSLFTNLDVDPSISERTDDFELAFRLFGEQPLFGRGLFTFVPTLYRTIDNQALVTLMELGLVGTLAFSVVVAVALASGIRTHLTAMDAQHRHLGLALAASIAGIITSFVTFDALGFRQVAGLTFLLLGLAGAVWTLRAKHGLEDHVD